MLIVCGAVGTEPAYFDGLKQARRNPAVKVKVLGKGVAPDQLVRYTCKVGDGYDEIWCVVDTDEYDIPAAVRAARGTRVQLSVSDPCFEYWLILHFQDCHRPARCYDEVLPILRRHVPGYDKTRLTFAQFDAGVERAIERARARDGGGNPATGVWKLALNVLPD
ncbi:RloB family protein [Kutzneria albida]|uniref:RloB family protein n=1 Tax=Kutzneria TaxID=43356 RepID=UPI003B82CCAC